MQHLGTEATRSAMSTQHKELSVRSDREPSILAVVDGLKKSCRNLGITAHDEGAPVKDHHSIGAAEVTVQVLRSRASLLMQQIEDKVAGGRLVFGCNRPLYCWALIHSGWLDNRFVASGGQTALERASDTAYSGKLATFGGDILVYLAVHVVGTSEGVFLTRSIRRSADAFNLNRFAELENYPWEFGLAGLAHCTQWSKCSSSWS